MPCATRMPLRRSTSWRRCQARRSMSSTRTAWSWRKSLRNCRIRGGPLSAPDRHLIRTHPAIFPNFYALPTPYLDRADLLELAEFLPAGRRMMRWLLVAVHQHFSDILGIFRAWRRRRLARHPELNASSLRLYYGSDQIRRDLVGFLREHIVDAGDSALDALLTYEERLSEAKAGEPSTPGGVAVASRIPSDGVPVRKPSCRIRTRSGHPERN